ncbi:MAG: hypothetical protein SFU98_02520 [Leptospiraceae bacterium]|nr:hypothetical protein [Leptospiraceae bacterium]
MSSTLRIDADTVSQDDSVEGHELTFADGLEGSEEDRDQGLEASEEVSQGDTIGSVVTHRQGVKPFVGESADSLSASILAHNAELLRQFYFATTKEKAGELLAELIKRDPQHEEEYKQALADAKKEWNALPSNVRIQKYEKPAESLMKEWFGNKEPSVKDLLENDEFGVKDEVVDDQFDFDTLTEDELAQAIVNGLKPEVFASQGVTGVTYDDGHYYLLPNGRLLDAEKINEIVGSFQTQQSENEAINNSEFLLVNDIEIHDLSKIGRTPSSREEHEFKNELAETRKILKGAGLNTTVTDSIIAIMSTSTTEGAKTKEAVKILKKAGINSGSQIKTILKSISFFTDNISGKAYTAYNTNSAIDSLKDTQMMNETLKLEGIRKERDHLNLSFKMLNDEYSKLQSAFNYEKELIKKFESLAHKKIINSEEINYMRQTYEMFQITAKENLKNLAQKIVRLENAKETLDKIEIKTLNLDSTDNRINNINSLEYNYLFEEYSNLAYSPNLASQRSKQFIEEFDKIDSLTNYYQISSIVNAVENPTGFIPNPVVNLTIQFGILLENQIYNRDKRLKEKYNEYNKARQTRIEFGEDNLPSYNLIYEKNYVPSLPSKMIPESVLKKLLNNELLYLIKKG